MSRPLKKNRYRLGVGVFLLLLLSGPGPVSFGSIHAPRPRPAPDTVTIEVVPGQLKYATTVIEAEAGTELTIRLVNEGAMPHNVVLIKARDDITPVGIAAVQAQATDYVPAAEQDRILGHSSLAGPGEVVTFTITVPPPGEYPYICTFPGHFRSMQGTLTSVGQAL